MNTVLKFILDYVMAKVGEKLIDLYQNYQHKKKVKKKANEIIKTSKTREERSRRIDDWINN